MYSYDEILQKMVDKYKELSGFEVFEESDIMIRLRVLAGELFNSYNALEYVKRQMNVKTAESEYLDNHALQRGLSRKNGVKAKGEVTFSLSTIASRDIVIDKGTVVSTASADVKSFETDETVIIKEGTLSVKAKVTATKEGADHNVMKDTVCVMVTPPLFVSSVTNELYFSGGADAESDDDLRKRIIDSYLDISNSTNEIYYKRLVQSVEGVYSSSVIAGKRGAGTLDIHICGKGEKQITREHIDKAQELVDKNRELNVDVFVLYSLPRKVYITFELEVLEGYDYNEIENVLKAKIKDYVDSLGVSKPLLMCELGDVIFHTQGVKKYNFIQAYSGDVYPQANEYCTIDNIEIRKVS